MVPSDIVQTEIISYERAELPRECQPRAPLGSTALQASPEMLQSSDPSSVQTLKPIHQIPTSHTSTSPLSNVSQTVCSSAGPTVSSSISGLNVSSGLSPWSHHPVMIEGVVGSMSHHDQIDLNLHSLTPRKSHFFKTGNLRAAYSDSSSLRELDSSGSSSSKYIPLQSSVKCNYGD